MVEWCRLDNRQRQMWTTMQWWHKICSKSRPAFCICQCPTIACDFLLILQIWSVLSLILTVTLVLQYHFYWSLLCSNLSPLPLPSFSPSLSLSVTDTTLSSERGEYRSCTLFLFMDTASSSGLAVCVSVEGTILRCWSQWGALSHKHHLHQEDAMFLYITLHVTANVEARGQTSRESNYESSIRILIVANQNLNSAYFPWTHFASTNLVNLLQ